MNFSANNTIFGNRGIVFYRMASSVLEGARFSSTLLFQLN